MDQITIHKLKQIIENRKHEKITNERGQFYFLTKLFLCFASELIPSIKHMRGEALDTEYQLSSFAVYIILQRGSLGNTLLETKL